MTVTSKKTKYLTILVLAILHVIVLANGILVGTVEAWDSSIAAIGVAASIVSITMAFFMFSLNHPLANCIALETTADLFSCICTTVFAMHTLLAIEISPTVQILLRFLILTPNIAAQIHLFFTASAIIEGDGQ